MVRTHGTYSHLPGRFKGMRGNGGGKPQRFSLKLCTGEEAPSKCPRAAGLGLGGDVGADGIVTDGKSPWVSEWGGLAVGTV